MRGHAEPEKPIVSQVLSARAARRRRSHFAAAGSRQSSQRAMTRMMQEKGGDALADVTIRESWFWAYVLNGYSVKIEGKVLKKRG